MDVRDVALAHSLALLDPRAKGRYILVSDSLNFLQMVRTAPFCMACDARCLAACRLQGCGRKHLLWNTAEHAWGSGITRIRGHCMETR